MMLVPRRDFNIFGDFFEDPFFSSNENKIMKTDIKEHDDKYEMIVDLPGFDKKDIKMHIEDGYLVINARTNMHNDEKDKKGKYIRKERYYGECSRKYYIGENIKEEDVKANFKNGTLSIEIPKVEAKEVKSKKYIEIGE
ncbi:MAG: Hsp20/alpha crystallin family protein [Bacillales bacterium]|nr:Hsp20/alpha crystallin family protein [Bacillales bacterium]